MGNLVNKYKELINYGIFGVLTTLINIISYQILTHWIHVPFMISNAFAWILGFVFAYYTNSKFVFGYQPFLRGSLKRFIKFFHSRILTGILDMFLMWLMVDGFLLNDSIAKLVVNVLVIILNYLMSKFLIFK